MSDHWICPVCNVESWRTIWSPVGLWEECRCGRLQYVFAADTSADNPLDPPKPLSDRARAVAHEIGALRVLEPSCANRRRRASQDRWDGCRTPEELIRRIAGSSK